MSHPINSMMFYGFLAKLIVQLRGFIGHSWWYTRKKILSLGMWCRFQAHPYGSSDFLRPRGVLENQPAKKWLVVQQRFPVSWIIMDYHIVYIVYIVPIQICSTATRTNHPPVSRGLWNCDRLTWGISTGHVHRNLAGKVKHFFHHVSEVLILTMVFKMEDEQPPPA